MRTMQGAALALTLAVAGCASHPEQTGRIPGLHVAQAAEESGDYQLAERVYASASESAPKDATVQLRYADALIREGKIDAARDVLTSHLNTVSNPRPLHGGLGMIYILQGQAAQAIAEFDAAGKADDVRWMANKGIALDLLGRHAEAQGLYRQALAENPNDTIVLNDLVLSLMLSGHTNEATALAAPLANDASPRIRATFGVMQAARGNMAGAREALPGVADSQLTRLAQAIDTRGSK